MPFGGKPACSSCGSERTTLWRKTAEGETLCNDCHIDREHPADVKTEPDTDNNGNSHSEKSSSTASGRNAVGSQFIGTIRKSARLKPSKHRYQPLPKALATKGKSRRVIFKKNPIKAAASVATPVTSEHIFHKGNYYQAGDIVSVMDVGGGIYFAQIRGFLQDQYCSKAAIITWLLPTTNSPRDRFDPTTYILGPEEDLPRKLDFFEFVCHAPSDYFKAKNSPYPTIDTKPDLGYIWTPIGYEIQPVPSNDELYGLKEPKKESGDKTPKSKEKEKGRGEREKVTRERAREKGTRRIIKTELDVL